MNTFLRLFSWTTLLCCAACGEANDKPAKLAITPKPIVNPSNEPLTKVAKAGSITLGGGCFWCVEAVYQRIEGITKVTSGYMGGTVANPTYQQICNRPNRPRRGGESGIQSGENHARKSAGSLSGKRMIPPRSTGRARMLAHSIARRFFIITTPTKRWRRSRCKAAGKSGEFRSPIVTEITPAATFYKAEGYHQNYFNLNANAPYCRAVIWPKLRKLGLKFKD